MGKPDSLAVAYAMKRKAKKMAKGGMADEMESGYVEHKGDEKKADDMAMEEDDQMDDMASRIVAKHYSKGGQVANDVGIAEADKLPAEYDDLVLRDDLEPGAEASDEIGDEAQDERDRDIIVRVMRSRAKGDRMPRPA